MIHYLCHRFSDIAYAHAPLFQQQAATLPALGLGAVQSALCTHIPYWDKASNSSGIQGCVPLLQHNQLKFYLSTDTTNRIEHQLGDGLVTTCNPTHLLPAEHDKCALATANVTKPQTVVFGDQILHAEQADDLTRILSVQKLGVQGTDIATSISLPALNGTKRTLWLLGDTPLGSYDPESCSRYTTLFLG